MTCVFEAMSDGAAPPPRITVSEWADANRYLSAEASAEHGPWRTSRTPYLREIMDCLGETSPVNVVVFAKGSQIGATEAGVNWMGYVVDHAPGPMMVLMPTDDAVKDNVRNRYDPMIEASPSVRAKVAPKGGKEGGNTLNFKAFPGGACFFRGTNSPVGLASNPIRYLHCDEPDRYPRDAGGEGSPLALAQRRTATFGDKRKEYYTSTPTIEGESRIWELYENTDMRRYYVLCPECGHMQTIEWARIKWSDDAAPYMVCEQNGCCIEERHKPRMLAAGEWLATVEGTDPAVRGYHLSALYSPLGWYSWKQARDEFLEATRLLKQDQDASRLKTFVNTVLGEVWAEKGESPAWEPLYARRDDYERNVIPAGGLALTASVDVQPDRLEVEVRAWGPRLESWSIDHRVMHGDTAQLTGTHSPWHTLDAMLSESWQHELGGRVELSVMAVDTGDQAQTVYGWCRGKGTRVLPVKGRADRPMILSTPSKVDVLANGKTIQGGLSLWIVGTNVAKSELYGWLRQKRPDGDIMPTGFIHWPCDYTQEFFEQLTAEEIVYETVNGYRRATWKKTRERNEALDLAVYQRAAAAHLGIDRWTEARWSSLRAALTLEAPSETSRPVAASTKAKVKIKRSTWL